MYKRRDRRQGYWDTIDEIESEVQMNRETLVMIKGKKVLGLEQFSLGPMRSNDNNMANSGALSHVLPPSCT